MRPLKLKPREPHTTTRAKLTSHPVDIGGRDIVIGFNEPAVRSGKNSELFSKLNARLPAYFLPAVDLAKTQSERPILYINSGINMAMRWNAKNEQQRLNMLAYNKIKFDFLRSFFNTFSPDVFSIIEYNVVQDPLRVPEKTLLELWGIVEKKHPKKTQEIRETLARFRNPEWSGGQEGRKKLEAYAQEQTEELEDSFKYALAHLFVFGDINFDGNYYLNPKGFASIGGHQEKFFNEVRNLVFDSVGFLQELCGEQTILTRDNVQIIVEEADNAPPPYSGATRGNSKKRELDEVTYENSRTLDYYDDRPKLRQDMEYIYQHVSRDAYEHFWQTYETRYRDLKDRYQEAYKVNMS